MHNWPQTSESLIMRLNDLRASESLLDGHWAIRFSDCPTRWYLPFASFAWYDVRLLLNYCENL